MDFGPRGTGWFAIRRHQGGFCVEGPGFYVWDEDPREVSRFARELARGPVSTEPARETSAAPHDGDRER